MISEINSNDGQNLLSTLKNINIKVDGFIKFVTPSFGAALTFPLIVFNGLTTVNGAGIILPAAIGYPLAGMLSIIYFILLVSVKVRRKYPLRTSLLIFILFTASLYTSFFSIYKEISEESLEKQSEEKVLKTHNQFLLNLNDVIGDEREKKGSLIKKEINLKQDLLELQKNQNESSKLGNDFFIKGDRASSFDKREESKQLLKDIGIKKSEIDKITSTDNYIISQALVEIQDKVNKASKEFIENSKKSPKIPKTDADPPVDTSLSSVFTNLYFQLFNKRTDQSTHNVYRYYLDNDILYNEFVSIDSNNFRQYYGYLEPNRDDYRRTPFFLVPIELSISGTRQLSFTLFAFLVAFIFELIPFLLGGINLDYDHQGKSKEEKDKIKLLYSKFLWIFVSTKLINEEDKREFLFYLYSQIDHNKKTIYLSKFTSQNLSKFISKLYTDPKIVSDKLEVVEITSNIYLIATSLLIDIMKSNEFALIEQDTEIYSKKEQSDANTNIKNKFDEKSPVNSLALTIYNSFPNNFNKSNNTTKLWKFIDDYSYQIFLDSWTKATLNNESIESYIDLIINFNTKKSVDSNTEKPTDSNTEK